MPYETYLRTDWWQWRRLRSLWLAGQRCQHCRQRGGLQVHHLTYERRGRERDEDLAVLCDRCHIVEHAAQAAAASVAPSGRTHPSEIWVASPADGVTLPPARALALTRRDRPKRVFHVDRDGAATGRRPLAPDVADQARALGLLREDPELNQRTSKSPTRVITRRDDDKEAIL